MVTGHRDGGPDEVALKRIKDRMDKIDKMPSDLRQLVHEEGYSVVNAFLQNGVKKAKQIRHLITVVREGSSVYGNGGKGDKT